MSSKYFILSILNSITQYFNYSLFGIGAVQLSASFASGDTSHEKLTYFFAIIVLAVIARPLGSVIFGSIGDRAGRKMAIILSGLTSSTGTIIVFFIPSFEDIGIYASIILIISRALFISGLSGEIDGIRLYIAETISKKRQNFGNGLVTCLTQLGPLLASSLIGITYFAESWRYCFLIGGIFGFIFSFVRVYLPESAEFKKQKENPMEYYKLNIFQLIMGQSYLLLRLIIIFGAIGSLYQFFIIFLPSFLFLQDSEILKSQVPLYIIAYGTGGVFWGILSDIYGCRKLFRLTIPIQVLLFLLSFFIAIARDFALLSSVTILASFLNSSFSVPVQIYIKNKINLAIRYRMFSFSHSIGSLFLSSPLPYICSKIGLVWGVEYVFIYPAIILILASFSLKLLFKEFD